jgi:hypothetical protein
MNKTNGVAFEMTLSVAQVTSLKLGAQADNGYCPGRTSVQRALLRRGCVDDQYKITAFGRSLVVAS